MDEKVMDRIKTALGDDKATAVLASLYGPLARRMQGLEDALIALANTLVDHGEVGEGMIQMMQVMGFAWDGNSFYKPHEDPNTTTADPS